MGTRSLTVMFDEYDTEIAVLYRQMDGYPSGHGQELAELLAGSICVNGIGMDEKRKIHNGGACLAGTIVAHFKTDVGQFYLYPAATRGMWTEYIYEVHPKLGCEVVVKVMNDKSVALFSGTATELLSWTKAEE